MSPPTKTTPKTSSRNKRKSKNTQSNLIHNLKCFYTNADQLRNKMSELRVRVQNENPMLVGVTEVKPKRPTDDPIPAPEYSIDNSQIALPMFANIMKIHKNVVLALAADAKLEQGWQNIRTMLA